MDEVEDSREAAEVVSETPEEISEEGLSEQVVIAEAVTEDVPEQGTALLKAVIEAAIYITDEPLTPEQIATAVEQPLDRVKEILNQLAAEYAAPDRALSVRELAGGYKMSTKPEHHEAIRRFVKRLQPQLKLSLAALETLAVIAYKQPITAPEIMEIRGVQGAGVLKTLLDRKLIATAGRKNVIGKPIMYKTTREFLIQFGLSSLAELPTLKEFEELGRLALGDGDELAPGGPAAREDKTEERAEETAAPEYGAPLPQETPEPGEEEPKLEVEHADA
jgi:segregation and condensation protein B